MKKKVESFTILKRYDKHDGIMFRTTGNSTEYSEHIITGFRKQYPEDLVIAITFTVLCDALASIDDILEGLKNCNFGDYFMSIFCEGYFIPYEQEKDTETAYKPTDEIPVIFYYAFNGLFLGSAPFEYEMERAMQFTIGEFQSLYEEENNLRYQMRKGEIRYRKDR